MSELLNVIGLLGNSVLPIFVFLTMFNVGLTQTMEDFSQHFSEWRFYLRMLFVNFLISPLLMWLLLQVFSLSRPLEIGLIIFSMAAGAPFVIKLTQYSEHDVALGATLMVILVLFTSAFIPVVLPLVLPGIDIDGWGIFLSLVRQLVFPILIGMILKRFTANFVEKIQPGVGKLSNITLWVVVVGILIGELEGLLEILGQGAILASVLFILVLCVLGYFIAGKSDKDHLQDLGALGSGQRNTAACMII
ncbi:MAG: bile acid:sodium symporter, partial [Desemzia incerta]